MNVFPDECWKKSPEVYEEGCKMKRICHEVGNIALAIGRHPYDVCETFQAITGQPLLWFIVKLYFYYRRYEWPYSFKRPEEPRGVELL